MTPPHYNTYRSLYNNHQIQQQFPPSQYGSILPNQHYSSTYPSQPQFNQSSIPPSYLFQSQMNHQTSSVPQITYQSPQVTIQPMTKSPIVDSGFAVLVFSPGDDLIAYLNKCTKFRGDKVKIILVLDLGVPDGQAVQTIIPNNAAFQTEDLNTYDSDCDDILNAKAVLMANIFNYGSDIISEVQQDSMILFVIEQISEQMINHVNNWKKANKEQNNESVTAELERYKE
ncbi:hypothetical protein Tco_1455591 [Tanacetum coccineum]